MKKFRFTLRSVQTVRSIRELRAREVFSAALVGHAKAVAAAEEMKQRLSDLQGLLVNERGACFRPAEHVTYMNALKKASVDVGEAVVAVEKAAKYMDECRDAWIETRKDVRVIENLEVKAKQIHRREYEHEEQAAMDDRTNALIGRAPLMMP